MERRPARLAATILIAFASAQSQSLELGPLHWFRGSSCDAQAPAVEWIVAAQTALPASNLIDARSTMRRGSAPQSFENSVALRSEFYEG